MDAAAEERAFESVLSVHPAAAETGRLATGVQSRDRSAVRRKARAVEVRLQPTQRLAGEHLEPHSDERTLRGIQDPVRRCDADDLVAEELSRIVDVVDLGVLAKRIVQLRVAVFDNASQGLFVDLRGGIIGELVHAIDKRVQ